MKISEETLKMITGLMTGLGLILCFVSIFFINKNVYITGMFVGSGITLTTLSLILRQFVGYVEDTKETSTKAS